MGLCNKTYFEGIYRNYSDELYRFLVYKFGNPSMAEDVTQNVFLNLWKNCAKYSDVNIKSLLYTMGRNDSLNVLRKEENKRKFVAQVDGSKQVHSPEFEMETKEIRFEPLEPRHFHWYRKIWESKYLPKESSLLYRIYHKLGLFRIVDKMIANRSQKIHGHSILAIYQKLD